MSKVTKAIGTTVITTGVVGTLFAPQFKKYMVDPMLDGINAPKAAPIIVPETPLDTAIDNLKFDEVSARLAAGDTATANTFRVLYTRLDDLQMLQQVSTNNATETAAEKKQTALNYQHQIEHLQALDTTLREKFPASAKMARFDSGVEGVSR